MKFGKLSESAPSCVTSWAKSKTELQKESYFMTYWSCSIVCTWTSPFPRPLLAAGLWVDEFLYKYQLQFNSSQGSVFHSVLAHWTGMYFSQSCILIHRSGQVSLGFDCSQLRLSDMFFRKSAFISCVLRPALLEPQTLTLSEGAKFIAWHLRHLSWGECW